MNYEFSAYTPLIGRIDRTDFIRRVYFHLFFAVVSFVTLEYIWFSTEIAYKIFELVAGVSWILILGILMILSWVASRLAGAMRSKAGQYLGLAIYVVVQSLVFIPLLLIAQMKADGGVIEKAAFLTIGAFLLLTLVVFTTKINLIGWGKYLVWAGILGLTAIVSSAVIGFELGSLFSLAMVGFAGAAILHDTSRILHYYDDNSYVSASLQLFASVAMMFWYLLRLFSSRR